MDRIRVNEKRDLKQERDRERERREKKAKERME